MGWSALVGREIEYLFSCAYSWYLDLGRFWFAKCNDQYRVGRVMSKRKPFNDCAGYIASKKNPITNIHNVIYIAAEQGIDADGKYVIVCEAHKQMVSSTSIPKARAAMKDAAQWCTACQSMYAV